MKQAHALTDNAASAGQGFRLSAPPPDVVEAVVALGQSAGPGYARAAGDEPLRLSEPPEDIVQAVTVLAPGAAAGRAFADSDAPRLSAPPPDDVQDVQVAAAAQAAAARAAAAGDEVGLAPPAYLKEADYTEELGGEADPERENETQAAGPLTNEEMYRIIREVAVADSGDELYSAILTDRDYPAVETASTPGRQFGLGFGLVLFTQESGRLGSVLRLMRRRDPETFDLVFGPQAEALIAVTNAATSDGRLQPVGGEPLSGNGWVERFRRAGAVPAFQAAQNEEIIEGQFKPMLKVTAALGIVTDRGLAMAYDRVVTQGLGGGLRFVVRAAGPLRTARQRAHAVRALGFENLAQFQTSAGLTPASGVFDLTTHAALVAALRKQGDAALPTTDELARRLYAAAAGAARNRLRRLLDSNIFTDVVYDLGG